jgi:hypothetical protein
MQARRLEKAWQPAIGDWFELKIRDSLESLLVENKHILILILGWLAFFPAGGFCIAKWVPSAGPLFAGGQLRCSPFPPDNAKTAISESLALPLAGPKVKMRRRQLLGGRVAQEGKKGGGEKSPGPGDATPESTEEAGEVAAETEDASAALGWLIRIRSPFGGELAMAAGSGALGVGDTEKRVLAIGRTDGAVFAASADVGL